MFQLPEQFFKNETVHRIIGNDEQNGVLSCGFLHKKTDSFTSFLFEYYGALLLLSGEGVHIDSEGKEHKLYPGCFLQRIPGKPHSTFINPDGNWVEFFICFGRDLYEALVKINILEGTQDVLYPGVNYALLDMFVNLLQHLKHSPADQLSLVLAEAQKIIFIIYNMHQRNMSTDENLEIVQQACIILQHDLDERQSIPELCKKLGVGYEKFRKLFKDIIGMSPAEYRIQSRMNAAKARLIESNHSVKHVALELGFTDTFTFSKQFKKSVGISPTEFKRKY